MSTPIPSAMRRKNLRLAWAMAALALLMLVSSIPFWRGLFQLIATRP